MYRQPFNGEWPISQYYGEKITSSFHTGIDYACPVGTAILASEDGVIRFSGFDKTGYGYCIIIEHDVTHATLYAHMSMLRFGSGKKVERGEVIGYSGNSGNSTGPHLHFEARSKWNDYRTHFDPMNLPMMTVDDSIGSYHITNPDMDKDFVPQKIESGIVKIICSSGAFNHQPGFTGKVAYPMGTRYYFTGSIIEKDGLTYCECLPFYNAVWIAQDDGHTQILLNE